MRRFALLLCILGAAFAAACLAYLLQPAPLSVNPPPPPAPPAPLSASPPPPPPAQPKVSTAPWHTYHGDAALRGQGEALEAASLTVAWRFLAGAPVEHTPVSDGTRVFVVNRRGEIFAVDAQGQRVWSKQLLEEGQKRPDGSPREEVIDAPLACFKGMLLAGAASGTLYALDTATGNERWRARIDGSFLGSPNLLAGTPGAVLAIDQGEAILHAFHPETGALLWKTESIDRCDGSPSAGSDFSAYGSCAAALHVVDTTAGKLVRSIEIEGDSQVAGGVAIDGDLLVSGCRSGKVLQVNARSGQVLWTTTLGDAEIFATPAINAQWVVAAMEDGTVSGLERATGAVKWTMKSKPQPASPILAGERVLLSARGTLYLLNLADGAVLWSSEIADEISSPAMAMGLVLIGGKDGALTALRP